MEQLSLEAQRGKLELIPEDKMRPVSPLGLVQHAIQEAIKGGSAMEMVNLLMQQQKEMVLYQAEVDFNESMQRAQSKMKRIGADATNPQTHSKYATYAKLDRAIRPLYSEEGFALSFNTEPPPTPETQRIVCYVTKGGHTRKYQVDMPADGKGAKGNDVMSKTHASGAAMSYGMRYLLKMIFNVAVGEDDDDGNLNSVKMHSGTLDEWLDAMRQADTKDSLQRIYTDAFKAAQSLSDRDAMGQIVAIKDQRKAVLHG